MNKENNKFKNKENKKQKNNKKVTTISTDIEFNSIRETDKFLEQLRGCYNL